MGIYDPKNSICYVIEKALISARELKIMEIMKDKGWQHTRAKRFVMKCEARRARNNC
jgi:hypothetical protein